MTRQETIAGIGCFTPSTFEAASIKNQMSYFIIPIAHEIYQSKEPKDTIDNLEKLGWTLVNAKHTEGKMLTRLFPTDPRQMNSIKAYLYNEMVPQYKVVKELFENQKNILFQKIDLPKEWTLSYYDFGAKESSYNTKFILDAIDLWIVDKHIAFFTLRTKLTLDDTSTVSEISSKFNRTMRDFRSLHLNIAKNHFSNKSEEGTITVLDWLCSLTENSSSQSLLSHSTQKVQDLQDTQHYYPIFNSSYNAKMITAIHVDEMTVNDEEIEPAFTEDLVTMNIDSTSPLEEVPYLLASSSELYPTKGWENNEEYISNQVANGEINIWKYWSGVALHDSLAFFSIGDGGSAIINSARHSYYYIYMMNLYVSYKLKYLEYKLIDDEFMSIENIRPMLSEMQRLRNQYMCTEISSLFQPNIVHGAIKAGMKTDDMFDEIKDNVETTLELTAKNTDILITVVISLFSMAGLWLSQESLFNMFQKHTAIAIAVSFLILVVVSIGIIKRSSVIRKFKKLRKYVPFLDGILD